MSTTDSDGEEGITQEEITGQAATPLAPSHSPSKTPKPRNAFTELMKPHPKKTPAAATASSSSHSSSHRLSSLMRRFPSRDGLGAYTTDPTAFPLGRVVIFYDARSVAIHDLYPKATVHTLLLPRSPSHILLHPFDALDDPVFLAGVREDALRLKRLAAKELRRRLGGESESERRREMALAELSSDGGEEEGAEIPPGRDWEAEIRVGLHARPSMNHLHVHVLSRDMHSSCLKHRKHYNSFNTPFLVDLADFPLAKDDPRRHPGRLGYMDRSLRCWRCGKEFGNKFKELKEHLEVEFQEWKRE